VKSIARSAVLLVALIAVTYWVLSFWFSSDADRHALLVSAILAAAVQLAAFGILHMAGRSNAIIAWGLGSLFRLTVLALYGFFLAKMLHLPLTAALVSFAVFLFVSMLLESLLIAL
jgi:hypothetical protein